MDFKKFEIWCKDKGFIFTLPSGYIRLNNLEVKSFESFKGLFNLCVLFFYEEMYKEKENETKQITFKNESSISILNEEENIRGERSKSSNWCCLGKEDYQKEIENSLLNDDSVDVKDYLKWKDEHKS